MTIIVSRKTYESPNCWFSCAPVPKNEVNTFSVGTYEEIMSTLFFPSRGNSDVPLVLASTLKDASIYPIGNQVHAMNQIGVFMWSLVSSTSSSITCALILALYLIRGNIDASSQQGVVQNVSNHSSILSMIPTGDSSKASLPTSSLLILYAIATRIVVTSRPGLKWVDWFKNRLADAGNKVNKVASVERLDAFKSCLSFSAIRSSVSSKSVTHLLSLSGGATYEIKSKGPRLSISSNDPFLTKEDISHLTLFDIKDILQYVIDMNQPGFNKRSAVSKLRKNSQKAVESIESVVIMSRGLGVGEPLKNANRHPHSHRTSVGDVDALAFAAFVRIFAEWRMLRLVPTVGYQAYVVGMGLARRDLLQNVEKLEVGAHDYILFHQKNNGNSEPLRSPTIHQLLHFEKEQKKHQNLPRLTDKSAASGILWIHRQIQYQTRIFSNLSLIEKGEYSSGKEAAMAAYKATFESYHGFVLRQILKRTLDAAPEASVIAQQMNLPYTYLNEQDDGYSVSSEPITIDEDKSSDADDQWIHVPIEPPVPVDSPVLDIHRHGGVVKKANPLEKIGTHILCEWLKFQRFIGQCNGKEEHEYSQKNVFVDVAPVASVSIPNDKSHNVHSISKPKKHTDGVRNSGTSYEYIDIPAYLTTAQPFLDGLDDLITNLNMKDPSRC